MNSPPKYPNKTTETEIDSTALGVTFRITASTTCQVTATHGGDCGSSEEPLKESPLEGFALFAIEQGGLCANTEASGSRHQAERSPPPPRVPGHRGATTALSPGLKL